MPVPPTKGRKRESQDVLGKISAYAASLPYSIEPESEIQALLDLFLTRITQCIEAKDYDPGLIQWDSMLAYWFMLKYPIPKEKRIKLARLYFDLCVTPGMPLHIVSTCSDTLAVLIRSKKKLSVEDLRLPWKPIYDILEKDLFLSRRQFEITQTSYYMGFIAETSRRFFHPSCADEMLDKMLPKINGMDLNSLLSTQYYLNTFLPLSHPTWLPVMMRLWQSVNSYMFDERHLSLLAQLAEMHVDPTVSDPERLNSIPDDATPGEERLRWESSTSKANPITPWKGIYKDVGIFTNEEWDYLMCKTLASMEIPLADSGSLTTGPTADAQASFEFSRLPKATWRIFSLARLIVYSMAPDGKPSLRSGAATPFEIPLPANGTNGLGGASYFDVPLPKDKTYLAGCKALDSLARLIVSTESFYHPSNSGSWTSDLTAFIKYIASEFNKRWHDEQKPDCKTPENRRLTPRIRRELVRCLRTVALLAMFSRDNQTVSNVQSALKSMTSMEPDLILPSILERAIPSLEALVETRRTTAVIKALGAVALALTSRDVYYPGAKHLLPILELLLPGIDLNDPTKTLCTTAFLSEISQHVKFGDLTQMESAAITEDNLQAPWSPKITTKEELPTITFDLESDDDEPGEIPLSNTDEDAILRESTSGFANWVTSFIRRVILLLENLPEEGAGQSGNGETETALVDSVTATCSQICVHLSEPLFDLVLNLIYDFASTTVRANAVRAVHQLVECVANANPEKTLARFVPFCIRNIHQELEHGASALRTTSMTMNLPSDATLHWNLAILRGTMCNDGRAVLKYKEELMGLLKLLHLKTFSKRGYSWTGKLLCSILLTLTHTYPLENKFMNPNEWNSESFSANHHRYWGKLYSADEVVINWHVPSKEEIDFALEILDTLITPTVQKLEDLLDPGIPRDAEWRNDFCRHLSLVRNAFAGTPTLRQEFIPPDEWLEACETSDVLFELPEFIASVAPIKSGFVLDDPKDPRHQAVTALRLRFGRFLHSASTSLQQQGDENTVDAVLMLIRSCRTYLFEYGDSRDGYYVQRDQYAEELGFSRRHVGQKKWPRALFVRRARLYHAARLRWNTLERRRTPLEDSVVDDMIQWSLWHYATVRAAAQSVLESMTSAYDGLRRRCLPQLYKTLVKGSEDDRMKGALYTLNTPVFAKFAMGEPSLTYDFLKNMFDCQWNEKPSIQECAGMMAENCLNTFVEPCFLVYSIDYPPVSTSLAALQKLLPSHLIDRELMLRCQDNRIKRHEMHKASVARTTKLVIEVAERKTTHWKYSIVAIRLLRTLIRRDEPISPSHLKYFFDNACAEHPTMRYYAQRAIMKSLRYIKLRTSASGTEDLAVCRNHNPLRRTINITNRTHAFTAEYLQRFRQPLNRAVAQQEASLQDKVASGWLAWAHVDFFLLPDETSSTFQPWEGPSTKAVAIIRQEANNSKFWEALATYYSEENHHETTSADNISCVKSIFQMLEDECFEAARPTIEKLVADKDQNKQRAAAELLAGLLGGSKHWPMVAQDRLWKWFTPIMPKVLGSDVKTDTLNIWTSFLEYVLANKDPRRLQPLVDWLIEAGLNADFNGSASFQPMKVACFIRTLAEELGWRFAPWSDTFMQRYWTEFASEHDEVRAYIADAMVLIGKIHWRPTPSEPTAEAFVRECRILPSKEDIMGIEHGYYMNEFKIMVKNLPSLREARLPGARAPRSKYDRTMTTIMKWLYQGLHDVNASSMFQYILPILPEVFKAAELQDSDELAARSQMLLVAMSGVTPPLHHVPKLLDAIFHTIQTSPSWRIRLNTLPILQIFYFRQVPLIDEDLVIKIQEVLCECLNDEVVEVREKAATTLSGILRCSPRRTVLILKERFTKQAGQIVLPHRNKPNFALKLRQLHAAVLGATALIEAFPYSVPTWLPDLILEVLARHTYDPLPISSTVRKCATKFKETHSDTWHEDSLLFNEEQMAALTTLLAGSSYYA